jgi:hypothetical protein
MADSIDGVGWSTGSESALAAYWPWLVHQDATGALVHIRNNPPANLEPGAAWGAAGINVTALLGTRLAMVPASANFTRIAGWGGYAVFYQGRDSRLSVAVTSLSGPDSSLNAPPSFPTS